MKKQILAATTLLVLFALSSQNANAKSGGLKRAKVNKPIPAATRPAPSNDTQPAAQPQDAIAVLKNLVWVTPRTVTSYKGDGSTYSWTPVIMFDTNGNIPSGAQYYATVSLPAGAPWVEMDCKWSRNDYYYRCGGPDFPEDKGTTATGVFPFTIKMRNELKGIDQTLFTGKVKIEKAPNEVGTPAERAKKSFYYPVHDWALPIGYLYYGSNENYLYTSFWVRGSTHNIKPHIFYKGKELDYAGGDKASCNGRIEIGDSYIRTVKPAPVWRLVECQLNMVILKDEGNSDDTRHRVLSNPGEYEIKVLWDDELARSIKFTVGPDRKLAGTSLLYKIDGRNDQRMSGVIVPVQVIGTQDGPWNKDAWKTDAYYGNPLAGFSGSPQ